ncbi:MAG: TIGR04255 family protein [Burkholderiaceae bacterium]
MVSFVRPPVAEVSLGRVFAGRSDLLVPHIGSFWSLVRDSYPKCQHAQLVLGEGEVPVQDQFGNWLPRVWMIGLDDTWLVQVQQDRLYVNWRAQKGGGPYPRFPAIKAEFDRVWTLFDRYVSEITGSGLQPHRIELAYTNIIPIGDGWTSVADLDRVVRDFRWSPENRFLAPPENFASQTTFPMRSGDGKLTVQIGTVVRRNDGEVTAMRMELRATGWPTGGRTSDEFVEEAHQHIVRGFEDLTTIEMHANHWIRQ